MQPNAARVVMARLGGRALFCRVSEPQNRSHFCWKRSSFAGLSGLMLLVTPAVAGDRALVEVAEACRAALRREDVFGRLGGDEFCAVLPGCAGPQAERVARSVQARLMRARVSIGIAIDDRPDTALHTVMDRADTALYAAKRAGRGRVELA